MPERDKPAAASPPDDQAAPREPLSGAVLWHGAWLIAVLIAWAAHYWWVGDSGNRALAVMVVPSAAGLVLAGRRQAWAGSVLVLLWALAGGLAAIWTGGLTGALGVWCLTPLAA